MAVPLFKDKHDKKPFIRAKDFQYIKLITGWAPRIKTPRGIIFCYDKNLLKYIEKRHKVKKYDAYTGVLYTLDDAFGKIAVIGGFGVGAPAAAIVLEEFIGRGVKKFISIGTAGTLQKQHKIGDIIVCAKSLRDEGTSYHYQKPSRFSYPSLSMTKKIEETLAKKGLKYKRGSNWTIDTPYRETIDEVKKYRAEGIDTVDMEASALFAIAKHYGVEIGALFTVSDSLADLEWKPKFHLRKTGKGLENLYEVAIETLL